MCEYFYNRGPGGAGARLRFFLRRGHWCRGRRSVLRLSGEDNPSRPAHCSHSKDSQKASASDLKGS